MTKGVEHVKPVERSGVDREPSFEERHGQNIVYWSKRGHAFMLIGDLPRRRLETLAASLAARIA